MGLLDALANMPTIALIIFAAGIILLAIEAFVPGFGVAGGVGLLLLFVGIVLTAQNLVQGLIMTVILLVLAGIAAYFLYRSATKGRLSRSLVLQSEDEAAPPEAPAPAVRVGDTGCAVTRLHPSGHADFDGERVDVMTRGEYIAAGTPVRVVYTDANRVVVAAVRT